MALIRCPECKKRFSSTASACPSCGAPVAIAVEADAREKKAKRIGLAVIGVIALVIAISSGSDETPEKTVTQVPARADVHQQTGSGPSTSIASADAREAEPKEDVSQKYVEQLNREIASIPTITASKYTDSFESITTGLMVIGAWGVLYEQGEQMSLDKDAQQKRHKFRALVSKKQAEMLPAMRNAYGPIMRDRLWEANGSARTVGQGYRTVEFMSPAFASNANIKKINDQMYDTLIMLRFTRSQYKWFRQADDYTYYNLKSPKDSDIVEWKGNGLYRTLK